MPPLSHLTSCTSTESDLYHANSLAATLRESDPYRLQTFHVPYHAPFPLLRSFQSISPGRRLGCVFREYASCYGEEFSAPLPTLKLQDHRLSAVRHCLFNIFAATLHIGGSSCMIFKVSRGLLCNMHCCAVYLCNGDGSCSQRGKNGIFVWYLQELLCSVTILMLML
jgi:hypothetical protein